MFYFFTGTDTEKAREKIRTLAAKVASKYTALRITDAHTPDDLDAALRGSGMFGEPQAVIFDHVLGNEELRRRLLERAEAMAKADDVFFVLETAPDAQAKKVLEKYAERSERFDAARETRDNTIFQLANALQQGKKKELWIGYQRELLKGAAPEAIHGTLFWAAKQALLRTNSEKNRALVAELAELPHRARRKGCELEYALEHFVLSAGK